MRNINAVTPGELLKEEFLEPMGISQYRLAKEIVVPAQPIGQRWGTGHNRVGEGIYPP